MENQNLVVEAKEKVRVMKLRKLNGVNKTLAVFDLCYDDAIIIHGLFLKKINGWFHIDFPCRQVGIGQEKEYLDTCRPATLEWRRAITEVVVEEWSNLSNSKVAQESHV